MKEAVPRYQHFRDFLSTIESSPENPTKALTSPADPDLVKTLFDSITDGIFICDPRMRILSFNRAAEEITGFSRDEVVGRECVEVCSGKLCGTECAVCQTLMTKRPIRDGQLKLVRKDGHTRVVQINTSLLKGEKDSPSGVVVVFRDMTELVSLQRELRSSI